MPRSRDETECRSSVRVLVKAIHKRDPARLRKLLEQGANANGADYDGNTPLHHAMATGDLESARLLVEFGGDAMASNDAGHRPYDVALQENFVAGMELLLHTDSFVVKALHESIHQLPRHIVDLYHERVDLSARDAKGRTALHVATLNDDVRAVRRLLARGIDLLRATTFYREETALHLVASYAMAKLLLGHCDSPRDLVNSVDRYALTPLSAVAVKNQQRVARHEQSRLIELLVGHGAHVGDALLAAELHLDYSGCTFDEMHGLKDALRFAALAGHEMSCRDEVGAFYRQLADDVERMKDTAFYAGASFYEFLRKSWKRRITYVDDLRVAKVVGETSVDELVARFPMYSEILRRHVDAACRRNELRVKAGLALGVACPRLLSLQVVNDKIVRFLGRRDMKALAVACGKQSIPLSIVDAKPLEQGDLREKQDRKTAAVEGTNVNVSDYDGNAPSHHT